MKLAAHHRNLLPAAFGALALAFAPACGDDVDNGGGGPDAGDNGGADADTGGPDANGNGNGNGADADVGAEERSGTVAITETTVLADAETPIAQGATTSIDFTVPGSGDGTVEVNENGGIGGCVVTTFGSGDAAATSVDEGALTVSGTQVGNLTNDGEFDCAFADGSYTCTMAAAQDQTMTAEGVTDGVLLPGDLTMEVTIDGETFEGFNFAGGFAIFGGFDDANLNGVPFPILSQDGGTLQLDAQVLGDGETAQADGGGSYQFIIGAAPFEGNEQEFIVGDADGQNRVNISKAASDNVAAFDVAAFPLGEGMVLAGGDSGDTGFPYLQPFSFLDQDFFDNEYDLLDEVRFACDGAVGDESGVCHADANFEVGNLPGITAFIVSGRTTDDADLDPEDPTDMGEAENYAEFTCAFTSAQSASISSDAISAILGTSPTRVETRVTYANGAFATNDEEPLNRVNLLAGHTLVGYSNVPASEDQ